MKMVITTLVRYSPIPPPLTPPSLPCAGEKPFDSVEDLVQDGLITLYMEANNVEEYLQSARQTRLVHKPSFNSTRSDPIDLSTVPEEHTHLGEEPVFNEEEVAAQLGELGVHQPRPRRPVYHPCTIPQQRDRTNVQEEGSAEGGEGPAEGEGLRGEEKPLPSRLSEEVCGTAQC